MAYQDTKETQVKSVHPVRLDLVDWMECPENQASKDHQVYQATRVPQGRKVTQAILDLRV